MGPRSTGTGLPFLDPLLRGGYGRVAISIVVIAVVFALLAVLINAVGRWRLTAPRPAV